MTSVADLRSKAQFYRAGVAGGILDGANAVAWGRIVGDLATILNMTGSGDRSRLSRMSRL